MRAASRSAAQCCASSPHLMVGVCVLLYLSQDPAAEITPVPVAEEPNISAVDKCVYKILGAAAAEPTPGTEEQMMADAVSERSGGPHPSHE